MEFPISNGRPSQTNLKPSATGPPKCCAAPNQMRTPMKFLCAHPVSLHKLKLRGRFPFFLLRLRHLRRSLARSRGGAVSPSYCYGKRKLKRRRHAWIPRNPVQQSTPGQDYDRVVRDCVRSFRSLIFASLIPHFLSSSSINQHFSILRVEI